MTEIVEVVRTGVIDAPADQAWEVIGDFGSIVSYFPSVIGCVIEGSGIGTRRHLTTDIGGTTTSELTVLDQESMTMAYRVVDSTVDIDDYTAQFVVRPATVGCEVIYSSRFRPKGSADPAQVSAFIGNQLEQAIGGLRRLLEP